MNTITDTELIARQAKRITELELTVDELSRRMKQIRMHIICIGGPLNDNKQRYSQTQLVIFSKILELVEEP